MRGCSACDRGLVRRAATAISAASGHREEGVAEARAVELERSAARWPASSSARSASFGTGRRRWHRPCAASSTASHPGWPSASSTCSTAGTAASASAARSVSSGATWSRTRRGAAARLDDLRHRALRDHPAAVQDQHVRAVLLDLVEEMRAQQHGGAALARDRADVRSTCRCPAGSRPSVGSSRNTATGSLTSARAMPSRCRIPRL